MKQISLKIIFILIFLLGVFFRTYKIDSLPTLNPDEAALGYNAYSILTTGKDEFGSTLPLHFKSFGDYKPGGYVYLAVPFIKLFGLNTLAIRLPNLIFSILTILLVYFLVFEITHNRSLSLISLFVISISPWHIHFSRGAWETSTSLFFILLGTYLYIKNKKFLFILPLIISTYIYHSARILSPLIALTFIITDFSFYKSHFKKSLLSLICYTSLSLPVLFSFLNNGGTARINGVGLLSDYGPVARAEELLNQDATTQLLYRSIHNKRWLYTISWAQKYLSHFDPNFLFIVGDQVPRSKSPDIGQLHLIELPLMLCGIYFLLKNNSKYSSLNKILLILLIISPLASSLTFQSPSALRSLPLVIPLSITTAVGLYTFIQKTSKFFPHNLFVLAVLYIYSSYYFYDAYFIHSPIRYPEAWNRGFEQIVNFINQNKDSYQHIYLTNKYDQPYILYLFFSKYPPAKAQSQLKLTTPDKFGFSTVAQIDNITFYIPDTIPQNSLIITDSDFTKTGESFKIYTK